MIRKLLFVATLMSASFFNVSADEQSKLLPDLFKKMNCGEIDERKLRDFFPSLANPSTRNFSDGYLPWEAVDKKIWVNRERELALQINVKRDKKASELEIILRNTCRPDLYFVVASFKLPTQTSSKNDLSVKDVEFSPLRISGTLLVDSLQGTEILGFLKYQPSLKSPEEVAEKLSLSFYSYQPEQKRYQLIDLFQVFPLKELER